MASSWKRACFVFAAGLFAACSSTKPPEVLAEIPETPPGGAASAEATWASTPFAPESESFEPAAAPKRPRSHVVKKGDTLFGLARQYYGGDASKWRRIWEANRASVPDKDKLQVGQELVIPD
jgi:5'-nucleotidase